MKIDFHMRVEKEIKNKLSEIAKKERRNLTEIVMIALEEKYPELLNKNKKRSNIYICRF